MKESFDQHAGQRPSLPHRLAAGSAELRQRHIDRDAKDGAHAVGKATKPARRCCRKRCILHGATVSRLGDALNST
jgi:hypothetical protein